MEVYPSADIAAAAAAPGSGAAALDAAATSPAACAACACASAPTPAGARIVYVEPDSPADDAGFYPGCIITAVNGRPLTDILAWQWESASDEVTLAYVDADGDAGEVTLERDADEAWGLSFDGAIFDGVRLCKNACLFCFMSQLPASSRASLTLRDDDYRLSFLQGTFVTLTNLTDADVARIIAERISPLRVSLHAANADVRRTLIGKHAARGLAVLEQLLAAGITCYAQIVLVPNVNDGAVLEDTLTWAYERPNIAEVGIVPLGYTRHQSRFTASYEASETAAAVLDRVAPLQARAQAERGHAWVYCADEFYCNAHGAHTPEALPPAAFYGECSMYEDGIGIVRTYLDSWERACASGAAAHLAATLAAHHTCAVLVFGESVAAFAPRVLAQSPLAPVCDQLFVHNAYFGGNVNVTGLLCGCDICDAITAYLAAHSATASAPEAALATFAFCIPRVIFNDDGVTLDGMSLAQMERRCGARLCVVSCLPEEFIPEIDKDLR